MSKKVQLSEPKTLKPKELEKYTKQKDPQILIPKKTEKGLPTSAGVIKEIPAYLHFEQYRIPVVGNAYVLSLFSCQSALSCADGKQRAGEVISKVESGGSLPLRKLGQLEVSAIYYVASKDHSMINILLKLSDGAGLLYEVPSRTDHSHKIFLGKEVPFTPSARPPSGQGIYQD